MTTTWHGEAVRTQSPELILGDSLSEFMRKVGIYSTSGDTHTRLRNQRRRLFGCTVSLLYEDARGEATLNAPMARLTEFWWSARQPDARALWESQIERGEDFFNAIIRCPIPIDLNTLRAMQRSPRGLALDRWLTDRPAGGGPHLRLALGGGQVAETPVGTRFVVVPPPVFDPDPGLRPIPKPFQRQAFVPERPPDRSLDQSSLRSTVKRSGKLTPRRLGLPHHEYWAMRLAEHLLGHAPEPHLLKAATAVGAHDNEIDVVLLGVLDDLIGRGADSSGGRQLQPFLLCSRQDRGEFFLPLLLCIVECPQGVRGVYFLNYMV